MPGAVVGTVVAGSVVVGDSPPDAATATPAEAAPPPAIRRKGRTFRFFFSFGNISTRAASNTRMIWGEKTRSDSLRVGSTFRTSRNFARAFSSWFSSRNEMPK